MNWERRKSKRKTERISIGAKTDFQVIFAAGWTQKQSLSGYQERTFRQRQTKSNWLWDKWVCAALARSPAAAISRVWISYEASCWFNSREHSQHPGQQQQQPLFFVPSRLLRIGLYLYRWPLSRWNIPAVRHSGAPTPTPRMHTQRKFLLVCRAQKVKYRQGLHAQEIIAGWSKIDDAV